MIVSAVRKSLGGEIPFLTLTFEEIMKETYKACELCGEWFDKCHCKIDQDKNTYIVNYLMLTKTKEFAEQLLSKAREKSYKSPTAQVMMPSEDGSSRWMDDSLIPVVALEDLETIIKELTGEK